MRSDIRPEGLFTHYELPDCTNTMRRLSELIDHVRGPTGTPVILEYGDYECPY